MGLSAFLADSKRFSIMRSLIFFLVFALLAAYTLPSGAGMSGCSCNGFIHNGEGNCYGKSAICGGNNWCYIANSSTCEDAQTSINGAPYRWSCLACKKDCIGKPREDLKLLCSDGRAGDKWDGCFERGSVRVQCPRGRSPCNGLRKEANFSEFHCQRFDVKEKNCTKYGGVRDCINEEKDYMCIEEPREDDIYCVLMERLVNSGMGVLIEAASAYSVPKVSILATTSGRKLTTKSSIAAKTAKNLVDQGNASAKIYRNTRKKIKRNT